MSNEAKESLKRLLGKLTAPYREVLEWRLLEALSWDEIAYRARQHELPRLVALKMCSSVR